MMKRHRFTTLALSFAVLSSISYAQTSAGANANGSVSSDTSVRAGGTGVNAQSDASANASANTTVSKQNQDSRNHHAKGDKGTSPSARSTSSNAALAPGTTLNAVLTRPIDSKKCKAGDEVTAKTTQDVKSNGQVVIPKGSKLVGHVTEVKGRGEGEANSSLALVFDHATLKGGEQVQMNTMIQALARPQVSSLDMDADSMTSASAGAMTSAGAAGRSGGGLLGGAAATTNAVAGTTAHTAGNLGAAAQSTTGATANSVTHASGVTGMLNSSSTGVVGMKGLSLDSSLSNATHGSVLTSSGKSIHLDSGTQMVLKVVQ